jgi:hypothetical protein
MKKILIFLILFSTVICTAQEVKKSVNIKLSKKSEVFQVVDEKNSQLIFFLNDKYTAKTIRFNKDFDIIDSLTTNKPEKGYVDIVGYSVSGNSYYSYWSNSNNKEIISQCFDFNQKKVSTKSYSIEFEKEKPIKKITVNNIFYLITIIKQTSILNLYIFNDGVMTKKTIDLSNEKFFEYDNMQSTLWDILNKTTSIEPALSIQNILQETPPTLTFSASKRKVYITEKNELLFTFDENNNLTQTLTINLSDYTAKVYGFAKPYFPPSEFETLESNSFYVNDKMLILKTNSSKMILLIKNMDGTDFKVLEAIEDKEIDFKNSEIIQENMKMSNTRVLDKSNQLIRKIYNLNPSVTCYSEKDKLYMTIGGVSQIQNNSAMYGAMFGLAGVIIATAVTSNYSISNLNSYANRKVVYINCLFDKDFNHINETVQRLPFDNLRAFLETNDLQIRTAFKLNNILHYGGYNQDEQKYYFYEFKN